MNISFSVARRDQTTLPVLRSSAITASDRRDSGGVTASPVPTYSTPRTGSIVGAFHTPPTAGPYNCTPFGFFFHGLGGSAVYVFQICLPLLASSAATPPRAVQHG